MKICKIENCKRIVRTKGYCNKHYQQILKYGEIPKKPPKKVCKVEGCNREVKSRGYCKSHYEQLRKKGAFNTGNPKRICIVEGCNEIHLAKGYCSRHDQQMRLYGKILGRTHYTENEFTFEGNICKIQLYNQKLEKIAEAIIDIEDYEKCKNLKWYLNGSGYVLSGKTPFLHHLILGRKIHTDHRDGDPLNNRKNNLRVCTQAENAKNCKMSSLNTSGYKGVSWNKAQQKWTADITVNYKHIYLGAFDKKVDAINAYNEAALKYHKEYARLNVV